MRTIKPGLEPTELLSFKVTNYNRKVDLSNLDLSLSLAPTQLKCAVGGLTHIDDLAKDSPLIQLFNFATPLTDLKYDDTHEKPNGAMLGNYGKQIIFNRAGTIKFVSSPNESIAVGNNQIRNTGVIYKIVLNDMGDWVLHETIKPEVSIQDEEFGTAFTYDEDNNILYVTTKTKKLYEVKLNVSKNTFTVYDTLTELSIPEDTMIHYIGNSRIMFTYLVDNPFAENTFFIKRIIIEINYMLECVWEKPPYLIFGHNSKLTNVSISNGGQTSIISIKDPGDSLQRVFCMTQLADEGTVRFFNYPKNSKSFGNAHAINGEGTDVFILSINNENKLIFNSYKI